jgi:hydrogenase maturation protease
MPQTLLWKISNNYFLSITPDFRDFVEIIYIYYSRIYGNGRKLLFYTVSSNRGNSVHTLYFIMNKISVIGLGNDILGDDAIGLIAVRELKKRYDDNLDIFESPNGGLELLDYLEGYEKAIILDSLFTGQYSPGTIVTYTSSDFDLSTISTPHYIGLPEVLKLAEKLGISVPKEIKILLIEVENPYEVTKEISEIIKEKINEFVKQAIKIIEDLTE